MGTTQIRYRCPCCGFRTLDAPSTLAQCPVCWWEDDGQDDADAREVRNTVNGELSLAEARMHYSSAAPPIRAFCAMSENQRCRSS